jgi:hypothetical protein
MIALLRQPNVVPSLFSQGVDVGEPETPRSRLAQRRRALAWGRLRPQRRGGEAQREHAAVPESEPLSRQLPSTRLFRACLQLTF